MKILINALIPKHLYHAQVIGKPDLLQLEALHEEYAEILDTSENPLVHCLINMKYGQHNPHLGEVYRALLPLLSNRKIGWLVVYHLEDRMLNFMFGVIVSMFKLRVKIVEDYPTALEFVQKMDKTLGHWGAELVAEPLTQEKV